MAKVRLDRIDRHILHDLQSDGRMTNVELAANVGISAPPCLRRVRSLEQEGFIKGYHADLDTAKLGYEVVFYALIGLESQSNARLRGFEDLVRGWDCVRECHMVRGGGDFLLKIVARNTTDENLITTELTGAPGVQRVTTFPVIRSGKSVPGVPVPLADPDE